MQKLHIKIQVLWLKLISVEKYLCPLPFSKHYTNSIAWGLYQNSWNQDKHPLCIKSNHQECTYFSCPLPTLAADHKHSTQMRCTFLFYQWKVVMQERMIRQTPNEVPQPQIMNPIPFLSCNVLHFAPSQPKASKPVLIQESFSADTGHKLLDLVWHLNHFLQGTPSQGQADGTLSWVQLG